MARKEKPAESKPVKMSKSDLLASMSGKAKKKEAKPAKPSKPVLRCESDEEIAALDQFTAADTIAKVAIAAQETHKAHAKSIFRKRYIQYCLEKGVKPENPKVQSTLSTANLQVKHRKKPKSIGTDVKPVADQLAQMGYDDDVIERITEKVMKETQVLGMRKFTELMADTASPEEQAVGEKILSLLHEHLDDDEKELVLEEWTELQVDDSWQATAVGIAVELAKGDKEKGAKVLDELFTVIPPDFVLAQAIYKGDTNAAFGEFVKKSADEEKNAEEKEFVDGKKKYKAKCKGRLLTLYMIKPDGEEKLLGEEMCENAGHAEAKAKKMFRESDYLNEFIADNAAEVASK